MIKKNTPHIKWIISFSDATQCGDGAIYRASGFYLTAIRESKNDLWKTPKHLGWNEEVAHRIAIQGGVGGRIAHFVLQKLIQSPFQLNRHFYKCLFAISHRLKSISKLQR